MALRIQLFTSGSLVVVNWAASMGEAYELIRDKGIRHLPVVDDEEYVIGLVSDRDFQRAMQVDQPDFISGRVAQPEFDPNARVRDFMSWPVEVIDEARPLSEAARAMIDQKISALLVTREGRAVGIVTTDDLLKAFLRESESVVERARNEITVELAQSPIGQIAQTLANAGI